MTPAWLTSAADFCLSRTGLCYWPVRVRGGIAADARWTLYPWTAYWRGRFEDELQNEMLALGDITGWTCWDLGAHYGLYTVGLARRTGPTGQVASFEPSPESFRRLDRHCCMNGLTWAKRYQAAVSNASGSGEFYTYGDLKSTSAHLPYEGETRTDACAPLQIPLVRLDDLVDAGELRLPNFIKVDVEGHAHKALAGAQRAIAAARPILIVAFHSPTEFDEVHALLQPLGYIATPVTPATAEQERAPDLIFRPPPRGTPAH